MRGTLAQVPARRDSEALLIPEEERGRRLAGLPLFGRIDAAQHLLEVHLHGLVAQAGAQAQALAVTEPNPFVPRVEHTFRLERLEHAAGIAAADTEQCRELFMGQRHAAL